MTKAKRKPPAKPASKPVRKPVRKTTRKPKTERVPRTRAGNAWTEASFFGFLRSGLRGISRRWPPLVRLALNAVRRAYVGPSKLQKWQYQCRMCGGWFKRTQVDVDHIEPCGSLQSFDDIRRFTERLFCETDKLRVVCNGCHATITHGDTTLPEPSADLTALRCAVLLQRGGRSSE